MLRRIKYNTFEAIEGSEIKEHINAIHIFDEDGNMVYLAKLSKRTYNPEWFDNFVSNPEEDINRIMIYELQDGAKLMLRKYKGAKKVYIEAKVADPVFGPVISYSLIEVGDIPTAE